MHRILIIYSLLLLVLSCGHNNPHEGYEEIAISRCLEQAIEIGEKYLEERALIENIALTEGTEAAVKVYDEHNNRANYEAFWDYLKKADSISRQVQDTLKQQEIISHLTPYINRIIILEEQIQP